MQVSQVFVALIKPKSPTNVGAVMRAAGCYHVRSVFYTGDRYDRAAEFMTDTKNVFAKIPLIQVEDFTASVPPDTKIVCVELVLGATPLPDFQHPKKAFYIFGPEDGSINQALIDQADEVVYIPTEGCMNLAATVNVVLYDRLAKTDDAKGSDELIQASRDRNNNLKVKRKEE